MRWAAKTCTRIVSTSGISVAAAAPTQSASVETSRSMPSWAYAALDRVRWGRRLRDRFAGSAGQRRRIDDAFARQMLRERTARRLAPFEGLHRYLLARRHGCRHPRRRLGLRGILFQIGELQLELIEQPASL